ncbi:MAG: 16S rRNA (cytidine(1402)-2'-O)-methyltransferase [Ruminococcus sp.]|nr:16S rRNA (cytidine(1402)-2'-O)-methyltransferase [Ruminococcus sp.]
MGGTLYIIGTPIGNLEDITLRQLRMLREVDFIAAEDTRVTRKLLNHFEINTPAVSFHEHSGEAGAQRIAARIQAGESCGIVTDAGMPCVSDPGEPLIRLCYEMGIPVTVVPGPSAVVTAISVAGQASGQFVFEAFLPVPKKERTERLKRLKKETRTIVLYEAPHKLIKTLTDLGEVLGTDRGISLCRELTKIHEEVLRTSIGEALKIYEEREPRGEYVLVIAGAEESADAEDVFTLEDAVKLAEKYAAEGMKNREACKKAATETGMRSNEIYSALMQG